MSNTVGSIIRKAVSKDLPNLLYVSANDDIYVDSLKGAIQANFIGLPSTNAPITSFNFDGIICTDRAQQFQQLFQLACKLHIPLICYEHLLPPSPQVVNEQCGLTSTINVFSQNVLAKFWNINKYHVVQPTIQIPVFDEIVRDFKSVYFTTDANGQALVNLVREKGMQAAMLTPEVDLQHVVYYINTILQPQTVANILKIMSMGGVICTLKHPMLSEIIIDQHNGIDARDTTELLDKVHKLLSNINLRNKISDNAKNTIAKQYNIDLCKKRWATVIKNAQQFVFNGAL